MPLGIALGLGRALLPKVGAWIGRAAARTARGAASRGGRVLVAAAGGVAADRTIGIIQGRIGRGSTPGFAPQGGGQRAPVPREGRVGRTISRILPGGMTGREFTPFEGTEFDRYGRPIAVYPEAVERLQAPSGYVIVDVGDEKMAMLKGVARSMGLWSPRPKPPISGYDARAIRRAARAKKRVAKLAKKYARC